MKTLLAIISMLVIGTTGASAAPRGTKQSQAASQAMAMVPPPAISWTGCYVGGNVGYAWAPTTWHDNGLEFASHDADGVIGGGQVGCDYQVGAWVFGIQGLFDATDGRGSSSNLFLNPTGVLIDKTHVSWLATLTGRVGYTINPLTLLYIKAGFAWVRADFIECCQPTILLPDNIGVLGDGIAAMTRTGGTVGAGVEHLFTPNISAFLEYNFIGLGSRSVYFSGINGSGPFIYHIDQDVHAVQLGFNVRFNPNR